MTDGTGAGEIDLQGVIDRALPLREGLNILANKITDCVDQLYPEEHSELRNAIARRQHEFATGRALSRQAMVELELEPGPILRGSQREPIWPEGTLGSITHADTWAVVSIARSGILNSIGIDLEIWDRVTEDLFGKLFTESEQSDLRDADPRLAGLMFSAKEAGYKATFPLAGKFIGFREAEVIVDWVNGRFGFRYIGDHPPNRVMESAEGYFVFCKPYVLSLVTIS